MAEYSLEYFLFRRQSQFIVFFFFFYAFKSEEHFGACNFSNFGDLYSNLRRSCFSLSSTLSFFAFFFCTIFLRRLHCQVLKVQKLQWLQRKELRGQLCNKKIESRPRWFNDRWGLGYYYFLNVGVGLVRKKRIGYNLSLR